MESIQNKILKLGLKFEQTYSERNYSLHTIERTIHPVLSKTSKRGNERHYQNLSRVMDILEDSQSEMEFMSKMKEKFPEELKDLNL